MNRADYLLSLINVEGIGLELGPSYNPLLPKSAGFNVKTVDYTDEKGLRDKYSSSPHADISKIEPVDFVVGENGLANSIGLFSHFDYVVASHVIEHTPNMLQFLIDCQRLLKPGGVLLLAVPDKRHCFDVFQPLTSTGMVIQAYLDARTRPTVGAIWDDRAYNALREGTIGWLPTSSGELQFFLDLPDALANFASDKKSEGYIDVHVWRFVPSSFRLIVRDLYEIGEINMREKDFHDSIGNEFYITLSSDGRGSNLSRLELAKQTLIEQAQIIVDKSA